MSAQTAVDCEENVKPRVTLASMAKFWLRPLIGVLCPRECGPVHCCGECAMAQRAVIVLTRYEAGALVGSVLTAFVGLGLGLLAWSVVGR